jgi:hypothetical protein
MNSNIKKFEYPDFGAKRPLRLIDIDTGTRGGVLLLTAIAALGVLSRFSQNTPAEILAQLEEWAREIYGD